MKKLLFFAAMAAFVVLPIIAGCAPKNASTSAAPAAVATAPKSATTPASATSSISAVDTEWAKVTEAAAKEGKVTLYTYLFGPDLAKPAEAAFHEKYPQIQLDFVPLATAVRVERIKTETRLGTYVADTSDGSPGFQVNLKKEGLTQSLGSLPAAKDSAWSTSPVLDPEGHVLSFTVSISTLWVNTTLVKDGEEPRSLKDLLDPKWKGKIIISEPATSNTASRFYTMYTRRNIVNDEYFVKLGPQLKFVTGSTRDITMALARGEAPLAWGDSLEGNPLVAKGAPIKPIEMEEGVLITGTTISLLKNAPHPNATRLLVNWLVSKEGQTTLGKAQSTSSLRADVPDFSPAGAQVKWKKLLPASIEDNSAVDDVFASRKLVDVWGRK